jgi:acetyl-CoA carboxylase biotin carboxylase subunit
VQSGFSPNLGVVERIQYPRNKNIRIDTGITESSVITSYFDSMLAKLIVFGETREKALNNTINALNKFWIKGIKTTIPFCKAVLSNSKFRSGDFNTSFIEKEMCYLFHHEEDDEMLAAYLATFDFAAVLETERTTFIDFEQTKNISPLVLNKRLRSL